jgi:hypothetical protein
MGSLDRGVGACHSHRDPDVGLREGRRVVDAVADHGDHMARPLKLADGLNLLGRQQLGAALDPERARDGLGDLAAVAS